MKRLGLVVLCFLCSGFASERPDYITIHGIKVYDLIGGEIETLKSDIEVITEIFVFLASEENLKREQKVRESLIGIELRLEKGPLRLRTGVIVLGGGYDPQNGVLRINRAAKKCLALTSLAHELGHRIEHIVDGKIDYEHEGEKFWGTMGHVFQTMRATRYLCEKREQGK